MYIDLLTKIKNAEAVRKESIKTAHTKMDEAVVSVLAKKGYIESYEVKGRAPKKFLEIKLKYDEDGRGVIQEVKFMSTPARQIRLGYQDILPVRNGYGSLILSTSKGILTGEEAKKSRIGGEALFKLW